MAKKKKDTKDDNKEELSTPGPDIPEGNANVDRLPVTIQSQYVRDLSFENPNAPMPMKKAEGKPNIDVDFAMDARKTEVPGYDNGYEVVLKVTAHAKKGTMTTFIIELEYGMMVTLDNVPEDKVHPLLLIEMPNYMFPYVRQIVSDLSQKAGYMPFMLTPVNFKALYRKRFGGPSVTEHKREEQKEAETA